MIAGENDIGKSTVGKALFEDVRNYLNNNISTESITLSENEVLSFPIFIETPDLLAKFNYLKNTSLK